MKVSSLLLLRRKRDFDNRQLLIYKKISDNRARESFDGSWVYPAFDFDSITDNESWYLFRFEKKDLERLRKALRIPDVLKTAEGDIASGLEGLCLLLRRLAYPNRWIDLRNVFGRSAGSASRLFYFVLDHIDRNFKHLLSSWDQNWLTEEDFQIFASKIALKGGIIPRCFGFIDGTCREICRPKLYQEAAYNGHKRAHRVKWQLIIAPNGMAINLYGGERGAMHDSRMFRESRVHDQLQQKFSSFSEKFVLYGDSGYGSFELLKKPYSKAVTLKEPRKRTQNEIMSKVREAVEWSFKEMSTTFAFLDHRRQMKIFEKPVHKLYRVATLLVNLRNCLYPNQTSQYFDLKPPVLEEYLGYNG